MSRRRPRFPRMSDVYSPAFLRALDAMDCAHGEPRGSRYCALCRRALAGLRQGPVS